MKAAIHELPTIGTEFPPRSHMQRKVTNSNCISACVSGGEIRHRPNVVPLVGLSPPAITFSLLLTPAALFTKVTNPNGFLCMCRAESAQIRYGGFSRCPGGTYFDSCSGDLLGGLWDDLSVCRSDFDEVFEMAPPGPVDAHYSIYFLAPVNFHTTVIWAKNPN